MLMTILQYFNVRYCYKLATRVTPGVTVYIGMQETEVWLVNLCCAGAECIVSYYHG